MVCGNNSHPSHGEEREGRQNREQVAPRRHEYEGPCSHFGESGRMDVKLELDQGYNSLHFKKKPLSERVMCLCMCRGRDNLGNLVLSSSTVRLGGKRSHLFSP